MISSFVIKNYPKDIYLIINILKNTNAIYNFNNNFYPNNILSRKTKF